ncbi:hypothetical protein E2P81_ATG05677 [Venturia nashicola]|uniref:Uncharacterized protein n=1 Tax=Venturia nashicola TaxID=86259 RepID=A0A4Z1NUP4_9PEZI|nr:hypothetical protein E6O75_ATG05815 [Venturia nashicola]TLD29383.1 hypothetical protein E2P81_ATG05677 [Venturia nashicola]
MCFFFFFQPLIFCTINFPRLPSATASPIRAVSQDNHWSSYGHIRSYETIIRALEDSLLCTCPMTFIQLRNRLHGLVSDFKYILIVFSPCAPRWPGVEGILNAHNKLVDEVTRSIFWKSLL